LQKSKINDFDVDLETPNMIKFPESLGQCVLLVQYKCDSDVETVITQPAGFAVEGCVVNEIENNIYNWQTTSWAPGNAYATGSMMRAWCVRLTGDVPGVMTFSGGVLPTAGWMTLFITTIQSGIAEELVPVYTGAMALQGKSLIDNDDLKEVLRFLAEKKLKEKNEKDEENKKTEKNESKIVSDLTQDELYKLAQAMAGLKK